MLAVLCLLSLEPDNGTTSGVSPQIFALPSRYPNAALLLEAIAPSGWAPPSRMNVRSA